MFQCHVNVVRGCSRSVSRESPLALHRGHYGDAHSNFNFTKKQIPSQVKNESSRLDFFLENDSSHTFSCNAS